jgi:hypothetical protein
MVCINPTLIQGRRLDRAIPEKDEYFENHVQAVSGPPLLGERWLFEKDSKCPSPDQPQTPELTGSLRTVPARRGTKLRRKIHSPDAR